MRSSKKAIAVRKTCTRRRALVWRAAGRRRRMPGFGQFRRSSARAHCKIVVCFKPEVHTRSFSKKIAPSPKTQGEEVLRGTTCIPGRPGAQGSVTGGPGRAYCVQPGSSEATKIRTRKGLHRPPSLWGCVFGSYSSSQLVTIWGSDAYTSSMMGEGFACCGLTSARNLLRDSRISLSAWAMASSVRFMESST